MISVEVLKNKNSYCSIECSGHALYEEYGKDIVCSAVSVLVINTLNSIEALTDDEFGVESNDGGYIYASFPQNLSHDSILLLDSLILGLQGIEQKYKKYFKLKIKEVKPC